MIIKLINKVISINATDFGQFNKLFEYISEQSIKTDNYDDFIGKLNSYFTEAQRNKLFATINSGVMFSGYNAGISNRTYSLYSILVNYEENGDLIKNTIINGLANFRNNNYSTNINWANSFLNFLPFTKHLLAESQLADFVNYLNNNVSSTNPDLMIKGMKVLGESVPKQQITASINKVISSANNESSKLDAFDFLSTLSENINNENDTLSKYASFLAENVKIDPERFLKAIKNKFLKIGHEKFILLMKNLISLDNDSIKINKTTITETLEKLFINADENEKLLTKIIEQFDIVNVQNFLNGIKIRKKMLEELLDNINNTSNMFKQKLIKLLGSFKEELETKSIAELFATAFHTFDDEEINDSYHDILTLYPDFRFHSSKSIVAIQLFVTSL